MESLLSQDCVLDHVAIAVKNLDLAQKVWEDIGLTFSSKREIVESQNVQTAFAQIDQNAHLELVCPVNGEGPIQKYIEKNGEGIHHICLKVKNVKNKTLELKKLGYKMIYDEPILGANQCEVNFIHPKSTGGILIEISTQKS